MSEVCSSCGQPVIPGAIFCDNCGNRLAPAAAPPLPVEAPAQAAGPSSGLVACPVCNVNNIPGAAFCENCGNSLAAAAPRLAADAAAPAVPFSEPIPPESLPPLAQQPAASAPAFVEYVPTPLAAEAPETPPSAPPQEPAPAPAAPPAPVFIIGSFQVAGTGTVIPIPAGKSEILVGREDPVSGNFPDVNLDPYEALNLGVSRQHCKLTIQGQQVMIEDLNSVNKTFLRGLPLVPGQRYPLQGGDEILLGRLRLVYNQ